MKGQQLYHLSVCVSRVLLLSHPALIILFFLSLLCCVFPPLLCSCCVGGQQCFWPFERLYVVNIVVCSVGRSPALSFRYGWTTLDEWVSGNSDPAWSWWLADANHLLRQHLVALLFPDSGRSSESVWIFSMARRNSKASALTLLPVPSWRILLSFKIPLFGYF